MSNFLNNVVGTPPVSNPPMTQPAGLVSRQSRRPAERAVAVAGAKTSAAWTVLVSVRRWEDVDSRVPYGLLSVAAHVLLYLRSSRNPPWGATMRCSGEDPLSNPWWVIGRRSLRRYGGTANPSDSSLAGTYAVSDPNLASPQVNTWTFRSSARSAMGSFRILSGQSFGASWSSRNSISNRHPHLFAGRFG